MGLKKTWPLICSRARRSLSGVHGLACCSLHTLLRTHAPTKTWPLICSFTRRFGFWCKAEKCELVYRSFDQLLGTCTIPSISSLASAVWFISLCTVTVKNRPLCGAVTVQRTPCILMVLVALWWVKLLFHVYNQNCISHMFYFNLRVETALLRREGGDRTLGNAVFELHFLSMSENAILIPLNPTPSLLS